ncbi:MAG: ASCH domain-containing protein [Saprospiraceae bacterium]|jgi:hypothetical protein|nr:ASCH domain-containing protein [Saprospiraceae bacterium]
MKCLSVKQPWASLIFHGKDIENRTWHTKYRGEVLIHVSAKSAGIPSELLNEEQFDYFNINPESGIWLQELMAGKYITSAIIGKVDIVDCVTNHPSVWAEKGFAYASMDGTQYKEIYNWVLANPVKFEKPILNVKGKLSFWDYDVWADYLKLIK